MSMLNACSNLPFLCELFDLLDKKIHEIELLILQSNDPDTDGLLDRGEYFIGVGFVACQQYLVDTLFFTTIKKNYAYGLGPVHSSGITYVELINSAANWWKHEPEWFSKREVPNNGLRTFDNVTAIAGNEYFGHYVLSEVLASICDSKLSFKSVVPFLLEWREAVHNSVERPAPIP